MNQYPQKTITHQRLSILQARRKLPPEEQAALKKLDSGYEGEARFYEVLHKTLPNNHATFWSLNFEVNGNESQYDCLHITHQKLYHFEIKNYQDNYCHNDHKWSQLFSEIEIRNPLHQLHRGNILMKEFLNSAQIFMPVESFIIFIHPSFYLYQANKYDPIIFYPQLQRFMHQLQKVPQASPTQLKYIQNIFTKANKEKSKYDQPPEYQYVALQKGVTCQKCSGQMNERNHFTMCCNRCQQVEAKNAALLRQIDAFQCLFPSAVLTVGIIYDWCGGFFSKKMIREILSLRFTLIKKGRSSHYIN